jgi:hypothetical protein
MTSMPGGVQALDHLLELADLLAVVAGGAVARHGSEVAERVVAPVVAQAAVEQVALVDEVMHRASARRR